MKKNEKRAGATASSLRSVNEVTDDLLDEAGTMYVQPQDDVKATAQPANLAFGATWVDSYYGSLRAAQKPLHKADGGLSARAVKSKSAECHIEAKTAKKLIRDAEKHLKVASANKRHADKHIRQLARRGRTDTLLYYGVLSLMLIGDGTGVSQPLINYGEVPILAIIQSVSASAAMVVSGFSGRALKDHHRARQRETAEDDLKEELKKYSYRFRDLGAKPTAALAMSAVVASLVPFGIGALRTAVDGGLFGLVFGLIAVGVSVASFLANYWYSDDVADMLADYDKQHKKAAKTVESYSKNKAIKTEASSLAEAASIEEEAADRGEGAGHQIGALPAKVKCNNGHAFGHGEAAPADPQGSLFPAAELLTWAQSNGHSHGHSNGKVVKP